MLSRVLRCCSISAALTGLSSLGLACTAFLVTGSGRVLLGNNEDFWDPRTEVWVEPGQGGRFGVLYLGYTGGSAQGGMNEKGLAFDGFATSSLPLKKQTGKPVFDGEMIHEAMATCATVDEVADFFSEYDLSWMSSCQLLFADRSGESVVIEGDELLRKQGAFQVATNFYQSQHPDDRAQCSRFASAESMLEQATAQETGVDLALCRRILAVTSQQLGAQTLYSNVFDLQAGTVYLYNFHNFEDVVVLDLQEELAKGEYTSSLPGLFDPTFAYESYVQHRSNEVAEQIAAGRGPRLSRSKLDRCIGEFRMGARDVYVSHDGKDLLIEVGFQETRLVSASEHVFFSINLRGEQSVEFNEDFSSFSGLGGVAQRK